MSYVSSVADSRRAARSDHRWLILVIVAVAQLMVVLDATVVNIALPSAQHALGFPNGDRQWVVTAYALTFGSLLLVGGRQGDMFSRKWVFITGPAGFAIASAIGGAAGASVALVTATGLPRAIGAILATTALGDLASKVIDPRARSRAYVAVGISGMALFGTLLFLTFYVQVVKGNSPLTTGLLFLPMIGSILISSNLSSNIGLGPRALIAAGMLLGAGGLVLLTQVSVTSSYVSDVLPGLLILGLGFGLIFAQAINTATAGVAPEDSGVASALVNTMQQVGGSIGTSALSTIALSATATYLIEHGTSPLATAIAATHGYTIAFGVSAGLLGLGFILTIVLLPSRRRLADLRDAGASTPAAPGTPTAAAAPAQPQACEAIPVALCSCSPVITRDA